MLLLNLAYQWTLQNLENLGGVIVLPSGNSLPRVVRENQAHSTVLFDPQLYLAQLDARESSRVCGRLASYPWFGIPDLPNFDSGEMRRSAWNQAMRDAVIDRWPGSAPEGDRVRDAARSAVEFQESISCTQIILPTPMIVDREDEAATQGLWLDFGIEAARELEVPQPILATVALQENAINESAFLPGAFLDTIVDQVTARDGLSGVYVAVAQTGVRHPFETPVLVLRAYAHLARAFAQFGYDTVFINFADVFGLPCLALGATSLATGPSQNLRRLSLDAFSDAAQGRAYPYFYSHRVVGELATESDLDRIIGARLLSRVRDRTIYSQALMEELARDGGSARNLPNWAESQNNTTTSHKHFVYRIGVEERAMANMAPSEKLEQVRDWLQSAASTYLYIRDRLGDALRGRVAPSQRWLDVVEEAVAEAQGN